MRNTAPYCARTSGASSLRISDATAPPAHRPAVDRRFDEVVEHFRVGDRVGQRALGRLVVEHHLELVPRQVRG
ncbi:hypothetical protein ACFQ1S_12150, partial [Kibdelosporangium lantanae]